MQLSPEQQEKFDERFRQYVSSAYRGSAEESAALRVVALWWFAEGLSIAGRDATAAIKQAYEKIRDQFTF